MNTEAEYQLMKSVLQRLPEQKIYEDRDTPNLEMKAIIQVKLRMFIIDLNMRPELPILEELQMRIKHTALMDELKKDNHKNNTK